MDALGPFQVAEGMPFTRHNSHSSGIPEREPSPLGSEIPLLTYGEEVIKSKQTNVL